jgi:hypothetical protein
VHQLVACEREALIGGDEMGLEFGGEVRGPVIAKLAHLVGALTGRVRVNLDDDLWYATHPPFTARLATPFTKEFSERSDRHRR